LTPHRLIHDYERIVALISDLHVGSRYGLCPEDFVAEDGTRISSSMNDGQRKLLSYWYDYINKMNDLQVDSVFILGDVCAGANPKESGRFMLTPDIDEQVQMAIKLLTPLCEDRKVAVWSGTAYHESKEVRVHKFIAEALNGQFLGAIANVQLEPTDRVVNVAHRSTEAMIYPETALGRDMMFQKEAEALGKLFKTHAIIRGHYHRYVEVHKWDLHYISLPCWQAFTPYEQAVKWYFKFQPDIGGGVMFVDIEGRLRFWHFLYDVPHIADEVVIG